MNMDKVNRVWHEQNRMSKNASFEERVRWHVEHLKHCSCRRVLPQKLILEMQRRGIPLPPEAVMPPLNYKNAAKK